MTTLLKHHRRLRNINGKSIKGKRSRTKGRFRVPGRRVFSSGSPLTS